jgi:uncharacterized protein (DUF58 family)
LRTSWINYLSRLSPKPNQEHNLRLSLGYPLLLHWSVLVIVSGLMIAAALQHWIPLLVITVFLLVTALVALVWSRQVFRALTLEFKLDMDRVFHGETVQLGFELSNGKSLMVPWLEIEAELPYRLRGGMPRTSPLYARQRLNWSASLPGGRRITWQYPLECRYRGDYRLGPLRLRSGDMLGFFPSEMVVPRFNHLLVYPEIVPLDRLGLPFHELTGATAATQNLYEDTSRTRGTRDYRYDDPLKRIHWKSSARSGQLQVRHYESTTSINLLIILDVASFNQSGADTETAFELAVTAAASCAFKANEQQLPVGILADASPEIRLPVSSGRDQLMKILEVLARVSTRAPEPLEIYLTRRHADLTVGSTLLLLSSHLTPSLLGTANKLRDEGHTLVVALCHQTEPLPKVTPITAFKLNSADEIRQRFAAASK